MDLLAFDGDELYFEEDLPVPVEALLVEAAGRYGESSAEALLLQALGLAPDSLNVLVAAYRYYYYQHRLEDALTIAEDALRVTARRLAIPLDWQLLTLAHVSQIGPVAMPLVRFHLLSLKAKAYLQLRLGREAEGKAILTTLLQLDTHNRLGARQLLDAAERVE